jgi:hypothetical protein
MTTLLRKINTGSTVFDSLEEYTSFRNELTSLKAYDPYWTSWMEQGFIDPTVLWSGFGTSMLEMRADFISRQDLDNYLAAIIHLDEARNATYATLGWAITREIID